MANKHRPFDGISGQIFRWLLDNGPAHAATIAEALNMRPQHVITVMQRYQDLYIKLGKVRTDRKASYLWSVWEN